MRQPWIGDFVPDEHRGRFLTVISRPRPRDVGFEEWREQVRELVDWDLVEQEYGPDDPFPWWRN